MVTGVQTCALPICRLLQQHHPARSNPLPSFSSNRRNATERATSFSLSYAEEEAGAGRRGRDIVARGAAYVGRYVPSRGASSIDLSDTQGEERGEGARTHWLDWRSLLEPCVRECLRTSRIVVNALFCFADLFTAAYECTRNVGAYVIVKIGRGDKLRRGASVLEIGRAHV
mgnify:CR=1 FL=1